MRGNGMKRNTIWLAAGVLAMVSAGALAAEPKTRAVRNTEIKQLTGMLGLSHLIHNFRLHLCFSCR